MSSKLDLLFVLTSLALLGQSSGFAWRWRCVKDEGSNYSGRDRCVRVRANLDELADGDNLLGLDACKSVCGRFGSLWPRPQSATLSDRVVDIAVPSAQSLHFAKGNDNDDRSSRPARAKLEAFAGEAFMHFLDDVDAGCDGMAEEVKSAWKDMTLKVTLNISSTALNLDLDTDESYALSIESSSAGTAVEVAVDAATFFGARHALETLSQLITHDPDRHKLQIAARATVRDKPAFKYRGLLLDTGRNYFNVSAVKRMVAGLARDKMNVFHWHMNEQHSFPFVSESEPNMAKFGAYSEKQVYTKSDIEEVVRFALVRGVMVLPEFDAPAHASRGWEWGPEADKGDLVVCQDDKWSPELGPKLAAEPNAGQLNPVNPNVYAVLENLYKDMFAAFSTAEQPVSVFHMGGDEVNFPCWAKSREIREWMRQHHFQEDPEVDPTGYLELWGLFQDKAYKRLLNAKRDGSKPLKHGVIMWTSELARPNVIEKYLPKDRYVIQTWFRAGDPWLVELINRGYRLIISNYDAWYLDCGFDAWVWDGRGADSNWCSPYKGWKTMYGNSPRRMAARFGVEWEGEAEGLVLGGEAPMWSEQVDENGAEARIWPRLSAVAERLWSDPDESWREAEPRMLQHRHRLVQRGIRADAVMPEFCRQNDGWCDMPDGGSMGGGYLIDGPQVQDDNQMLQSMKEQHEFAQHNEVPDGNEENDFDKDREDKDRAADSEAKSKLDVDIVGGDEDLQPVQGGGDDPFVRKTAIGGGGDRSGGGMLLSLAMLCFALYVAWLCRRSIMGVIFALFKNRGGARVEGLLGGRMA